MTTGLYAAYVTVTKVEMVASMVCVMEHDEKGGDLSAYRCKITIKKDKPLDEKIGGLQERRPAKSSVKAGIDRQKTCTGTVLVSVFWY